jgi:hypothetical protein
LLVCILVGYFVDHYNPPGLPLPSMVTLFSPECYIFGCSAAVTVILLFYIAWKQFSFFRNTKALPPIRTMPVTVLTVISPVFCVLSGLFFAGGSFLTIRDDKDVHHVLLIALFVALDCFIGSSDAVFYHVKTVRLEKWVIAYDIAVLLLQVPYMVFWAKAFNREPLAVHVATSACGWLGTGLTFGKFAIVGWQTSRSRSWGSKGRKN